MMDQNFFKAKGYADNRVKAETKELHEKVKKLETLLAEKDNTISALRAENQLLRDRLKR
jgi:hypothetical protein